VKETTGLKEKTGRKRGEETVTFLRKGGGNKKKKKQRGLDERGQSDHKVFRGKTRSWVLCFVFVNKRVEGVYPVWGGGGGKMMI